jgi:cyclic beta-1,2-glucan synthetase
VDGVKFVITLDADTQLPYNTARRLIETLAHPLNRPVIESDPTNKGRQLVQRGYTVIQPRVSTSLPSATATRFSRLFTDATGSDPYTHAISDVYQDLFGEGSYHGKGIYDVEAFETVLGGRFPDATLLSHDLLEGAHVRVGVASDIELFDQFPPNYLAYSRRNHRWLRGDWQIFDWVFPSVPSAKIPGGREPNPLSLLNKWKVADNLRRSKTPFVAIIVLGVGWLHSPGAALASSTLVGASLLLPSVLPILSWRPGTGSLRAVGQDLLNGLLRGAINGMLLPHTAAMSLDAISRTLYRKFVSKRHLLEWQTANDNYADSAAREAGFVRRLFGNSAFALASLAAVGTLNAAALPAASPFLLGWAWRRLWCAGSAAGRCSPVGHELDRDEKLLLRRLARQTWRYFDDFHRAANQLAAAR